MIETKLFLMLEDDPDDRFITEATLSDLGYAVPVQFVKSSTELFTELESSVPYLILLDYNCTPLNAVQVLQELKANPLYQHIPVVVLGDSSALKYVAECYRVGASSFVKKPTSVQETNQKIKSFFDYWLATAEA